MSEIATYSNFDVLSEFRSQLSKQGQSNYTNLYAKALLVLERFNTFCELRPADFTQEMLSEFIGWLFYENYSVGTVHSYLKAISAMYNKMIGNGRKSAYAPITTALKEISELPKDISTTASNTVVTPKIQALIEGFNDKSEDAVLGRDMLLLAIACGGLTFGQIAVYQKTDYRGNSTLIQNIVDRYSKPRHKYLFPLNQSERTPMQLERHIAQLISQAIAPYGLHLAADPRNTAAELWALAAYEHCGSLRKAASCAPVSLVRNLVFKFITTDEGFAADRDELVREVNHTLMVNPVQWHVMQFRPHVTYERVMERIKKHGLSAKLVATYYPYKEVARRIENRIVFEEQPVLPGLMFFMSRKSDITSIFRQIGDIAWCYRVTRDATAEYATIPLREMLTLQDVIGVKLPGSEYVGGESQQFAQGDHIQIIDGVAKGQYVTISEVRRKDSRTVYRLSVMGNSMIEWVIDNDSFKARKITEEEFAQAATSCNK